MLNEVFTDVPTRRFKVLNKLLGIANLVGAKLKSYVMKQYITSKNQIYF